MEEIKTQKNYKSNFLKKITFIVCLLFFLYILFVIWGKRLQVMFTFPQWNMDCSRLNFDLDIEEINILDSKWENINWLYVWTWTWKTVYYFHGNGGGLNCFYNEIKYISDLWYNVISYDFPWYGKSSWVAYKNNLDRFSKEFYDYIKWEKNIVDQDLIIWWYSIWSAIATDFASKNNFDKLILVSPLASRYDMSKNLFWIELQKYIFLKNSYITKELVKKIKKPVLIIHWNKDKIISFNQWKEIFENYVWEKNFIEIDNFWHNNIIDIYWDSLRNIFKRFLSWKGLDFKNNYFFLWEKEYLDLKTLSNLDLKNDSSIQKFVSSNISFNDKEYIPKGLEKLESEFVLDLKWWNQTLKKDANNSLQNLAKAFYEKFNKKLSVASAYRSYNYQVWIKNRWCPDNLCAKAWYSEHQSGLAVDIFEASTQEKWNNNQKLKSYYNWMNENAHYYWFHNTYQKWLEVDWYEIEPWHWRYVWLDLAHYLKENNLTFAEFYNKQKN